MRFAIVSVVVAAVLGCESKPASPPPAAKTVPLVDITAASSFADVRAAFNARAGEARFITLLSPT
jgi:hypothetical protein